jgi:NAD(P)H-hydrate epimerase
MRYVLTAAEMQALDRATITEIGIPGAVLMENAGRAVAEVILGELSELAVSGPRVAVVCGAGNNGGDGYVIARWLREAGCHATVYLAAADDKVSGDARTHLSAYQQSGGPVRSIADQAGLADARDAIEEADVAVDCLFGTGLDRPVEGHFAAVIEAVNRCAGTRVAVDIPSGLSADRGEVLGVAVAPHITVTMAFLKVGLATAPGFARAGEVQIASIGIPRRLAQVHGITLAMLQADDVAGDLPRPELLDHKNRRGHVVAVAGSPGKRGAGRLTAWAALRAGAGLVTLAGPDYDEGAADPIMTAAVDSADALRALADGKRVVAIGPGMQTDRAGADLVTAALDLDLPLVIDADGLNHLVGRLDAVATGTAPAILTPHPGEAARLLDMSPAAVERDRVAAVRQLAELTRSVVVLKGARTLVCDGIAGDGFVSINPTGNPGLATAGSGDVLTGLIAGLVAQATPLAEAARLAVWLHGAAADQLADELGQRSITASDLIEALPGAMQALA